VGRARPGGGPKLGERDPRAQPVEREQRFDRPAGERVVAPDLEGERRRGGRGPERDRDQRGGRAGRGQADRPARTREARPRGVERAGRGEPGRRRMQEAGVDRAEPRLHGEPPHRGEGGEGGEARADEDRARPQQGGPAAPAPADVEPAGERCCATRAWPRQRQDDERDGHRRHRLEEAHRERLERGVRERHPHALGHGEGEARASEPDHRDPGGEPRRGAVGIDQRRGDLAGLPRRDHAADGRAADPQHGRRGQRREPRGRQRAEQAAGGAALDQAGDAGAQAARHDARREPAQRRPKPAASGPGGSGLGIRQRENCTARKTTCQVTARARGAAAHGEPT